MMEVIEDLPAGVVGIASRGKITKDDYETVLIPVTEKAIREHGKIKFLYQLGDFEGMELGAMWDDITFGLKHWSDFSHLALVTDNDWIKNMTALFAPLIPAKVRIFSLAETDKAREWLVTAMDKAA